MAHETILLFYCLEKNHFRTDEGKIVNISDYLSPSQIRHFKEGGAIYGETLYKHRTTPYTWISIEQWLENAMSPKILTLINIDDYPHIIQIYYDKTLNGFRDSEGLIVSNMCEILKSSQVNHFKERNYDYDNACYKHRTKLWVAVFIERWEGIDG